MDVLRRLYTILKIMPKDMDDTNKNLLAQLSPQQQVRLVSCLQHGAWQHVLYTWYALHGAQEPQLHTRPAGASCRS